MSSAPIDIPLSSSPSSSSLSSDFDLYDTPPSSPTPSSQTDCECCIPELDPPSDKPSTSPRAPPTSSIASSNFFSVVCVGGGPHGLALAARLAEDRPAALYTDLEHARLSWLRKQEAGKKAEGRRRSVKGHWAARKLVEPTSVVTGLASDGVEGESGTTIKVFDNVSDGWMGKWKRFFKRLEISHLRSPMFFQPSPADEDALVAYARRMGKEDELVPIAGVVGKEKSKHARKKGGRKIVGQDTAMINERLREDYFRPSTPLFNSFISTELVERYHLSSLVEHATVTSVTYGPLHIEGQSLEDGFTITSVAPDGTTSTCGAKSVVFAVGATSTPNFPPVVKEALGERDEWQLEGRGWCHSAAFATEGFEFPSGELGRRIAEGRQTSMVVVGGGLTSAQISDLAIRKGVSKVYLLTRGPLKVQHFDFTLDWVTKFANLSKMAFWQEPDLATRIRNIKAARGGGTVNPMHYALLKKLEKAGSLEIKTWTQLTDVEWDEGNGQWKVAMETLVPDAALDERLPAPREPTRLELEIDYLVLSTGSAASFSTLPFVSSLLATHPIEILDGYPAITPDLQWDTELPAFVMGAYAMCQLGPDGSNLSGTRGGAERIVRRLGELGIVGEGQEERKGRSTRWDEKVHRSSGGGGYFQGLEEEVE
ncbi:FAD binding domain protein [Pseudohyphozyma bogoriensis]|nr:FAD binding domain protein [Pseudohyphozyma bogoriensis]